MLPNNPTQETPTNKMTPREWAIQTRAALIQLRKAKQEELRALGMQISALERLYDLVEKKQEVVEPPK